VTTPPAPPAPTPPAPPAPPPPAPPAPSPTPPAPTAEDVARLTAALDEARRTAADAQRELAKVKRDGMTDAEKQLATARAEGKAEAEQAAALKLVAAEFRIAAAGRIANPDAALAALDLGKLAKDGEPDKKAIAALVEQLAAVPPPPPPPGHVPTGPRAPAPNGDVDFIRQIRRR
jgi:hypothetical protein